MPDLLADMSREELIEVFKDAGVLSAQRALEIDRLTAELEQQRESIRQAYIDIAELPCGMPDPQWTDFVNISAEDAWQIAFSAGLMAAGDRVKTLLPTKD